MAKPKKTLDEFLFQIAKEFSDQLETDKKVLFCKVCQEKISAEKRSQVTQHFNTARHKTKLSDRPSTSQSQQLLSNMVEKSADGAQYVQTEFNKELCDAFLSGLLAFNWCKLLYFAKFNTEIL